MARGSNAARNSRTGSEAPRGGRTVRAPRLAQALRCRDHRRGRPSGRPADGGPRLRGHSVRRIGRLESSVRAAGLRSGADVVSDLVMDGNITITPPQADPDSSELEVLRSSFCLAGIAVIFPAIPAGVSRDHLAVRFWRNFDHRSVQPARFREPVQAWRTLRWSLGTAAAACTSRCTGIHCRARQPIGLPPRQGDTGSDHLDPRDASCVPVFFWGPR